MAASKREVIELEVTPEFRQRLEQGAKSLNLSLTAYILYLQQRYELPDSEKYDRHVKEAFGRHGKTIRKLAE